MKILISILSKTLVTSFYKEYALFFGIVLYFCFGIMRPSDHIYLNELILNSGYLSLIYFLLWALYSILISFYVKKAIGERRNWFLYDLYLVSRRERLLSLFFVQVQLLAPILFYFLFILYIAVCQHQEIYILYFAVFFLISSGCSLLIYEKALRNPDQGFKQASIRLLPSNLKKPYFSFYFFYLFQTRVFLFFISKLVSLLLLAGCMVIFQPDKPDIRPLGISMLLSVFATLPLINAYHFFENKEMISIKNMPLSRFRIFLKATCTFGILMIPELILLARNAPSFFQLINLIEVFVLGLSILITYYAVLFFNNSSEESFTTKIFWIAGLYFFVILFNIPIVSVIVLNAICAFGVFYTHFYTYEYSVKSEE